MLFLFTLRGTPRRYLALMRLTRLADYATGRGRSVSLGGDEMSLMVNTRFDYAAYHSMAPHIIRVSTYFSIYFHHFYAAARVFQHRIYSRRRRPPGDGRSPRRRSAKFSVTSASNAAETAGLADSAIRSAVRFRRLRRERNAYRRQPRRMKFQRRWPVLPGLRRSLPSWRQCRRFTI